MNRKQWVIILSVLAAAPVIAAPPAYRLRTEFTGPGKCLDIVNDGKNDQLTMAPCGNFSGQHWTIEPSKSRAGHSRLRTEFTGSGKCLDIVNDGTNDQLTMAKCEDVSGQLWTLSAPLSSEPAGRPQAADGRLSFLQTLSSGLGRRRSQFLQELVEAGRAVVRAVQAIVCGAVAGDAVRPVGAGDVPGAPARAAVAALHRLRADRTVDPRLVVALHPVRTGVAGARSAAIDP